eukprot:147420-Lingulodinium_polyedra.AAC.1
MPVMKLAEQKPTTESRESHAEQWQYSHQVHGGSSELKRTSSPHDPVCAATAEGGAVDAVELRVPGGRVHALHLLEVLRHALGAARLVQPRQGVRPDVGDAGDVLGHVRA